MDTGLICSYVCKYLRVFLLFLFLMYTSYVGFLLRQSGWQVTSSFTNLRACLVDTHPLAPDLLKQRIYRAGRTVQPMLCFVRLSFSLFRLTRHFPIPPEHLVMSVAVLSFIESMNVSFLRMCFFSFFVFLVD